MDLPFDMCAPALLYFVLLVIAIIVAIMHHVSMMTLSTKFLFGLLWTWLLKTICTKGYKTVAWILVFLPFIVVLLFLLIVIEIIAKVPASKAQKTLNLPQQQQQQQATMVTTMVTPGVGSQYQMMR